MRTGSIYAAHTAYGLHIKEIGLKIRPIAPLLYSFFTANRFLVH